MDIYENHHEHTPLTSTIPSPHQSPRRFKSHHHHHHQLFDDMSCLGLNNQLLPPKKVWEKFTSKCQSRVSKLKRSKAFKHAKTRLNTILYRPRRKKDRTRRLHHHRNLAPVYVDELYGQATPVHVKCVEPSPEAKGETALQKGSTSDQFGLTLGAAAAASASSCGPSLSVVGEMGDVDLRAEMFIRKFREEMRLQRQRSFGEYQEMLARGL